MKYCWMMIIFLLNVAVCQANRRVGIIYQNYQYGNIREYAQTFLMLGQMMRENNFTLCLSKDQESYFCQKIIKKSFTKEQGGRVSCHKQLRNCDFVIYIIHGDNDADIIRVLSQQDPNVVVILFDLAKVCSYIWIDQLTKKARSQGINIPACHIVHSVHDCMKLILSNRVNKRSGDMLS